MGKCIIASFATFAAIAILATILAPAGSSSLLPALGPIAIEHVSVINVLNGAVERDTTVILTHGQIAEIGRNVTVGQARVIDATGKYLIPGLWDMHVHCCNSEDHFFPLFLANGVTGIRDMFAPSLDELKSTRAKIENATLLGPRMFFSGPIIDGPKPIWPGSIAVSDAASARDAVDKLQRDGADFIKVYSLLPRDAYFAIAGESKKRGIPFCGHVPDLITASEASDAGQKSFEHLLSVASGCSSSETNILAQHNLSRMGRIKAVVNTYDESKAEALFARFRGNATWQCPTFTVLRAMSHLDQPAFRDDPRLVYMPADIRAYWNPTNNSRFKAAAREDWETMRLLYSEQLRMVGLMAKARVDILAGTDTPNPFCFPGFSLHDELALLTDCGLTPLQALQCATINSARYLGLTKKFGSVEIGKAADLVLLDANPLDDIHNTVKIRAVFVRGRLLDRDALDQLLRGESKTASLRSSHVAATSLDHE